MKAVDMNREEGFIDTAIDQKKHILKRGTVFTRTDMRTDKISV